MAILTAFQLDDAAAATTAETESESGVLWGVSLGATTKVVAVGPVLVVQSTPTRAAKLHKHSRFYRTMDVPDIQKMDLTHAALYGLGRMG